MEPKKWLVHPRAPLAIVSGLTALFLIVGLWNLGAGAFPSSGWRGDGEAVLDLGSVQRVDRVFFAVWDPEPLKAEVSCGQPGEWSYKSTASAQGDYKQWVPSTTQCDTRYLRLNFSDSRATVAEVVPVRGLDAVRVSGVSGPPGAEKLADEAALVSGAPTYFAGAYFDEIYFMRTADEYLRRAPPFFEWTHPPLGKDLIALSILVAGNGPFGWRLLGVLAGAAAIPAAFLLGRNLLGNRRAGIVAAALVTFDFMHFTQARISTGEIFLFLFLTGMWAFFAKWWMTPSEILPGRGNSLKGSERTSEAAPSAMIATSAERSEARGAALARASEAGALRLCRKHTPPADACAAERARAVGILKNPLFLALLFFGLALSVKVVAVNSLAALLLLALVRVRRERDLFRASVRPFLAGLAAAGAIYLATYAPYYASGLGLGDVLSEQCCGPRSIWGYHSTLEAPHPYGSPWWSWPLILHPLWMYGETFGDKVSTIVSMGNPVVWWAGLAFVVLALSRARRERAALFIGVAWLVQWAALAPIPRVLFIYHYFPNVALLALGCAWGVERAWEKDPKRGLWLAAALITAAAVLFLVFYPVISGTPVDSGYKEALRWVRLGFPLWWTKNYGQPANWDF